MPSTYAHRRFGADVLALLPDGLRATLEQHRELYDMGLHGPDLMFYYKALQSNPVNRLGNAMHEQKGEVFFTRARTVVENATDKKRRTGLCAGLCLPLRAGQHLSPLCGGLCPGERCGTLRDRDGV